MYIEIIIRYIIILLIGKETNNERLTLPNEGSTILIILIIGNLYSSSSETLFGIY